MWKKKSFWFGLYKINFFFIHIEISVQNNFFNSKKRAFFISLRYRPDIWKNIK